MYPQIKSSTGTLLAVLDNIIKESASIKRVVNGEFTFTFSAFEKELKSEFFSEDNSVIVGDQTFDIKYLEQSHAVDVEYKIQCEHVNYRLCDGVENTYASYAFTGTPTAILANILAGTGFSVGSVEFTTPMTISVNKQITKKALIKELANLLGGEIEYTGLGFTINLLDTIGQDNGFQVRFGKNLKGITKSVDKRGGLKTSYSVDLVELKNSNEYIQKDLSSLEVVGVGDTIRIIDQVIGLDVVNRIVSITYNPIFAVNTKLEIANYLELVTDTITAIQTTMVSQGALYNNVSIGQEDGFKATRSDDKAETLMNATEGIAIYSRDDVGNPYLKVFYVDLNGKIQATAIDISGDSTFKGTLEIGSAYKIKIVSDGTSGSLQLLQGTTVIGSLNYDDDSVTLKSFGGNPIGINASGRFVISGGDDSTITAAEKLTLKAAGTGGTLVLSGEILKVNTWTAISFDGFEDVNGNDYTIANGILVSKFNTGRVYATQEWVEANFAPL